MCKENQNGSEICKEKLKKLVNKKELYFTKRCNKSIELAVILALSRLNSKKERFLLVQEEGGWITYKNYAKKHKMTLINLKMENGKIVNEELKKAINRCGGNAILIMHSLPGYSYTEDMKKIKETIKDAIKGKIKEAIDGEIKQIILINDCCGSIGTNSATVGDIIVCSFGEAKPLSIGKEGASGGFIASDNFYEFSNKDLLFIAEKDAAEIINFQKLNIIIDSLQERLLRWHMKAREVKKELIKKGFNILNQEEEGSDGGINVLAEFSDEDEKERLINYCADNRIEYTECPRYIRTNRKALSLEIKRLEL
jgi:hypothetical protein